MSLRLQTNFSKRPVGIEEVTADTERGETRITLDVPPFYLSSGEIVFRGVIAMMGYWGVFCRLK